MASVSQAAAASQQSRRPKRVFKVLGVVLLSVLVVYGVAGYVGSSQAIGDHPEWRKVIATPSDFGLRAELISFQSRDRVPLKGWWLSALGERRGNVVLAHGRDANRSHMLSRANFLVHNGYNVIAIDLRDHGESGGGYISPGYLEARDILGAVNIVRDRRETAPIVVFGHSYGAVAALNAATQSEEIAGVISDGAFASATEVLTNATRHYLASPSTPGWAKILLLASRLPGIYSATAVAFFLRTGQYIGPEMTTTMPAVSQLSKPVLFISGEQDFISPTEDARRMFAASPSARKFLLIIPGAGHNTTYRAASAQYETAVLRFLDDATGRK